jgi:hypothetical protein
MYRCLENNIVNVKRYRGEFFSAANGKTAGHYANKYPSGNTVCQNSDCRCAVFFSDCFYRLFPLSGALDTGIRCPNFDL